MVISTTIDALGLTPGRPARLSFASSFRSGGVSDADFAPKVDQPDYEVTVDFRPPASAPAPAQAPGSLTPIKPVERPRLRGRARVGRVLRCVAPAAMTARAARAKYSWRRGSRPIHGAKRKTLKLRRADAGKRVSCRVTATVAGRKMVATSRPLRVAKKRR